ncbi:MAG: precorrin-8X methylmutase [Desulfatibacillum sp.]|nr:precorrin-8X methylmutase [Desulfatibacillum sp.]
MKPHEIETQSFAIIDQEAGDHGFSPDAWKIVRRMIHTTADFEYIDMACIHPLAIEAGVAAIQSGCAIITDTNMARVGIRTVSLEPFGCAVSCFMADPAVGKEALERGVTRAYAAVEKAAPLVKGGIYVVGNAPTALLHLLDLIQEGAAQPALVVGLPVGFVNAAESKEALMRTGIPHISNQGRKGGSNIAASVINALALIARERT